MTKSSSSGGTKVGSDLSRISDMFETPSKYVEGHPTYRRRSVNRLVHFFVFSLAFLALAQTADAAPVSRYDLLETACKAFWNRAPDETAVLRSHLLEPFPDGRIHLDWPATRGTAMVVLYKLLEPALVPSKTQPAEFTDIQPGTALGSAAAAIGGYFEPTAKRRFSPDRLLAEGEFAGFLEALRGQAELPTLPPIWLEPQEASPTASLERHFPVDFKFSDPATQIDSGCFEENGATDARRIDRLHGFVSDDQLAPQGAFDLTSALEGMSELEKLLDTLEITVHDLTTADIPPERVSETLEAFDEIGAILAGTTDKLRFSRQHLEAALLTDPARLRDTAGLRLRIVDGLRRVVHLKEKIDARRPALSVKDPDKNRD
ncbi:MAG TPA: hypothetical protein PKM25_04130 [Candidatus Ozemobacteraceae bacterium]|nr:hypothetical protein [Candidatus Ozemobacteraceae bacterium]